MKSKISLKGKVKIHDDGKVRYVIKPKDKPVKDLFDYNTKINTEDLIIGDSFGSSGYQSSSVILDNCYGIKHNDTNIILEILVPPKSGTAAYIENFTGCYNYCQMEMLIKRDATMTVVGDVYKKIVNGIEKTFIPVVVQ